MTSQACIVCAFGLLSSAAVLQFTLTARIVDRLPEQKFCYRIRSTDDHFLTTFFRRSPESLYFLLHLERLSLFEGEKGQRIHTYK